MPASIDARFRQWADDNDMEVEEAIRHLAAVGLATEQAEDVVILATGAEMVIESIRTELARLSGFYEAVETTTKRRARAPKPKVRRAHLERVV